MLDSISGFVAVIALILSLTDTRVLYEVLVSKYDIIFKLNEEYNGRIPSFSKAKIEPLPHDHPFLGIIESGWYGISLQKEMPISDFLFCAEFGQSFEHVYKLKLVTFTGKRKIWQHKCVSKFHKRHPFSYIDQRINYLRRKQQKISQQIVRLENIQHSKAGENTNQ